MTEEMLRQAAGELACAMDRSLPEPGECSHRFSAGFERKMKRLLRRADHPGVYRGLRAAASILLVISIGVASLLALSPEARAAVLGWVRREYGSFFEYHFEGESEISGEVRYCPQWVPEGYELESAQEIVGGERYIYSNKNGQSMLFSYMSASESSKLYAEGAEYNQFDVEINGNHGEVFTSDNSEESNLIVWTDSETGSLLYLNAFLDKDSLVTFAENVIRKPDIPLYCPGWMPDGYELVEVIDIENGEMYIYFKGTEAVAQFSYATAPSGAAIYFDGVGYEHHKVKVNGLPGDVYLSGSNQKSSEIVWWDSTGNTMFLFSARVSEDDLIRFAESIQSKK